MDLAYYTDAPAGGEWTQASFNAFEVHLGRTDTGTNAKISEVYADVDYNGRPVGTATAPTGTVTDTTRPLVTWTYADPDGDRQQAFQVRVFTDGQYLATGFDPLTSTATTESGWQPGEDLQWTVGRDLVNDTYRPTCRCPRCGRVSGRTCPRPRSRVDSERPGPPRRCSRGTRAGAEPGPARPGPGRHHTGHRDLQHRILR